MQFAKFEFLANASGPIHFVPLEQLFSGLRVLAVGLSALLEDQSLSPDVKRSGIENVQECWKIVRIVSLCGLPDREISS